MTPNNGIHASVIVMHVRQTIREKSEGDADSRPQGTLRIVASFTWFMGQVSLVIH